jgi:uncharacterized Zn finger protein
MPDPFWSDPDFPTSGPIRVEGGIRARSRRGAIGDTWWSRRFIDVLESLELGGRLARGRSYARAGQVLALEVTAGSVVSRVQGSRPKPYVVSIELGLIWPKQWERVERTLAGQVIFSAKLLAGEMPHDLEQVLADLGLSLFPDNADELTMECSCPDWSIPCKHVAATLYVLAEAFDADPFLVLAWRGRTRTELLANLRRLRGTSSSTVDTKPTPSVWDELAAIPQPPLADCLDGYFAARGPTTVPNRPGPGIVVPDAILRERDELAIDVRGTPVTELLRKAYLAMAPPPTR